MGQIACQGVGDQAPLAVREYLLQQEENAMRLRISSVLAFSLVSLFLLLVLFLAVHGKWDSVLAILGGIGVLLWAPKG